ncbi:hypothetical protein [Levilactobacillus cerevisiae]|uniref:hypothetical protein n=2 Tax=Levilactobacillus cerevisiae TaxID=1704076 RepID=UPI00345E5755
MQRALKMSLIILGIIGIVIAGCLAWGDMVNNMTLTYGDAATNEIVLWELTSAATVIFAISLFWIRFRGITCLSGLLGVVSMSGYALLVGVGLSPMISGYLLYLGVGCGLKCYANKV